MAVRWSGKESSRLNSCLSSTRREMDPDSRPMRSANPLAINRESRSTSNSRNLMLLEPQFTASMCIAALALTGVSFCGVGPCPIADLGHIPPVLGDILLVFNQLFANGLFGVGRPRTELWKPVDPIGEKIQAG